MSVQTPQSPPTAGTPWAWHIAETYKGLITLSVEALKMLAIVNGGAAVAILTYLGNLVSRTPPQHAAPIKSALLWYCSGLLAVIFAFVFAYLTQLRLYGEERARHEGKPFLQLHTIGIVVCSVLALFSALAFGAGCLSAADALIP